MSIYKDLYGQYFFNVFCQNFTLVKKYMKIKVRENFETKHPITTELTPM